jgi:hypothetical protein
VENKDQNGIPIYGVNGDDGVAPPPVDVMHEPPPGSMTGLSLDDPVMPVPPTSQGRQRSQVNLFLRFARRLDVILIFLLVVGAAIVFFVAIRNSDDKTALNADAAGYGTVEIPLNELISGKNLQIAGASNVTINGYMQLNSGLSLAPSVQPTGAKAGQIYYDQGTNQLAYFNGENFVFLTDSQQGVQSLGGATGQLVLGNGLGLAGQQITNTGVLSVQGQAGNVSFTAGSGIILNGTTISNGGVISIVPGSSNVSVSDDGNGNVTIDMVGAGTGTVTSSGGTAGTIPLFTTSQNIEDSIITQSGLTVTISGDLSVVTGGLSLSNALTVSNGGTGTNSLAGNGVLVGNGTSPVSSVAAGAAGLCLLSTAGVPTWAACPSSSGVASLNGLTGALTIANASAAGSTITIDDASTTTKGIASFNSNNFSTAGGAVNTIQDIHSGATPSFAGVNTNTVTPSGALTVGVSAQTALLQGSTTTITSNGVGNNIVLNSAATIELQDNTNVTGNLAASGDLAVNGGDITSSGVLNITPGGTLTVGVASQTLTLQGGPSTTFRATSGGNTTIVGFTSPTANTTLNFPALTAGTYTVCTSAGNCAGATTTLQAAYDNSTSPEIVLDATRGALTIRDNAAPLGANLLEVQSNDGTVTYLAVTASGVAVTGTATVSSNVNTTSGAIQTNGTSRIDNSGNLVNIGSLTLSGAISGGTTITGSGNINTTGGALQTNGTTRVDNSGNLVNIAAVTASGSATFQGGGVTIGTTSQAGSLVLNDGSSNTGTLQVGSLGQNTAYILPDPGGATATICLSTGNCAGSGGGVTTVGGTTNRVTKFTGSQTIGDSIITDNGTTVSVGGAFTVTGNGTLQGGTLTLGTSGQAGLIILNDGSSNTGTLQVAALGQDTVFTLPDPGAGTATICLSTGNCAGAGGGVTTSGGTTNRLPLFTGAQSIGNSWLLQNSSTLELDATRNLSLLGGNLSVTGNTTLTGDIAVNGGDVTSTGALNITPGGTLTIGVAGQQLVLQGDASTQLSATDGANTTSVVFQTPTADVSYRFATTAAGTYDVCTTAGNCVGTGGGVSTPGGTTNRIAKFSGSQTIDDSTITDDGTTVTTSVDMVIQGGTVTLGTASQTGTIVLHDGDGQTTSLQAGDSSGDLTFILPTNTGAANQCLKQSGTGNQLVWQDCDGGSSGSSATLQTAYNNSTDPEISLNSSVGGVSIRDNATPISGNLFEIQNSAGGTTYFGVSTTGASVTGTFAATGNINTSGGAIQTAGTTRIDNSGNLINIGTVSAGTYNGQTISSTASFTGTVSVAGNTTLTGDLAVNGGDITSSGALNITPGGTLTIGATGQQLVLQGSASTTLAVTGGGFTTTVGFTGVPVGNVVYNFDRTAAAGTYDICTTVGNCLNVFDNVTGSGTIGTIPVFTGSTALGDSLLSQSGGTVTVNGNLNLVSGNQFQVNGTQISSANLSNDSNLAKLSASQTFTGNTVAFQNTADSTNAFNIQNQAGARVLTVNTDDAQVELGIGSSLDGKLVFSNVSNNNTVTILPGTPTTDRTITLPDADGIVCLDSGNCAGAGATLQTAYNFSVGGTTPKIKVNSTKGGVDIQDADATINGSLFTVRASDNAGLGAAMFDVQSTGAVTLQNASNSTTALSLLTQGGTAVLRADTTNGRIILGQSNTLTGALTFTHSGSAFTGTLTQGALGADRTYTLPNSSGTVCLDNGNCASVGGGVTTSGGTTNRLAVFTGAQTLGDSWLNQNSSTLELDSTRSLSLLGGNLSVTGNGTFSGDIAVNGGDITSTGALTLASGGSGNVTINGAGQFVVEDVAQFNAQVQADLASNDEVFITGTGTGANTRDYVIVSMTNNTSSGNQNGLFIQNAAGTGTTEGFALFDNADTDTAVTYGIQMTSGAGGITTALDVSDSDIGVALGFGANDIDGTNFDVAGGSGNITTNGTYNTNTFNSSTLQFGAAGTATVSSAASQALNITSNAAATWSVSSGNLIITAQGNLNLGVGGGQNINIGTNNAQHTITIGNQGATGTQSLIIGGSGNVNNAVSIEAGNTGGINIGNGATAHTINIGAGAAAQAITIGSTNSTSATTIQGGSGNITLATSNGNRIQIGSATTDATTVLLTVDSYDGSAGTPSGTNGSMYYDTSTNAFRCYQNGAWMDCITASGGFVSLQNAYTNSTGGTTSEIILRSTQGPLDIQDRSTGDGGTLGGNILNVRATAANDATAGSILFSVGNTGNLTAAGTYNTNTFTSSNLQFGAASTATIQAANNATANGTGRTLTLSGGDATSASCGTACIGGDVIIQGGTATGGSGVRNGGSIYIDAGSANNNNGTVNIGTSSSAEVFIGRPASGANVTLQAGGVTYLTSGGSATGRIQVGDGTGTTTPDIFVLDMKSSSGDPGTTNEGAMYYNNNSNKFRCYQNTGWTDCISTMQGAYTQSTGGTTSEVILDATRGAVDIQDRSTSSGGTIGANLLNVRATAANDSTAGSLLLGVGNTGAVTSQNSTDSANAFRILNSTSGELVGVDSSSSILRLLNNNTGHLNSFQTAANDILDIGGGNVREGGNSVTVDGYVYYLGGCGGGVSSTTVYYARLNNDGSTGTWATTDTIPQATCNNAVTAYNGYIYVNGGTGNSTNSRNVYYARPNSDGTISSWSTASQVMPSGQAKRRHAMVAYNGRLYIIGGGLDSSGTQSNKVHMGTINADGSVNTMAETGTDWLNSNGGDGVMATVANGYLYVRSTTNVVYGKIAANGTIGTTGTVDSDALSSSRAYGPLLAMNGYLYSVGGDSNSNTVSYSPLNSDGSIGAWTNDTSLMPANRTNCGGVVKNGYIYCIAGYSGSAETGTVFYAGGARVTIGGSLDLIANSGENVAEGGTGGELTAGNTSIVGTLNVSGNANFKDGAIINNNFAVTGLTVLRSTTDSTTAFQMLNSSGVPLFVMDTTNSYVYIGNPTSDTTGALLVLDTKSSSGDPTGVNGAMYYNSSLGVLRCYQYDEWRDCGTESARNSFHAYTDLMGLNGSSTQADQHFFPFETILGGEVFNDIAGVAGHPGIVEQEVDVDNSMTALQSPGLDNQIIFGSTNTWRYETSVRIPTLSNATDTFVVRSGFLDSEAYSETDTNGGSNNAAGCYFKYSHGVNSGRWQGTCVNNSATVQTCDLYSGSPGTTVAASTWYRLTVAVNSAGNSVDFRVNGSATNGNGRCQIVSQIPTGGVGYANFLMKTNGSGDVTFQTDYIDVLGQFGTPR